MTGNIYNLARASGRIERALLWMVKNCDKKILLYVPDKEKKKQWLKLFRKYGIKNVTMEVLK